jgi:hypothetical protein
MLEFSDNLKIYYFKDRQEVSLSIKISDNCAVGYHFTSPEFEDFINGWETTTGFNYNTGDTEWFVQVKTATPRPESLPASYVRISTYRHGTYLHHRVDVDDMRTMVEKYHRQKITVNHWD